MEINYENINELYRKFISDSVLLQNGKEVLETLLEKRPNFIIDSLSLFLDSKDSLQIRKYVGILIKNLLKDNWETNPIIISNQKVIFSILMLIKNIKKIIREMLLQGIAINLNEAKLIEIIVIDLF